MECVSENKRSQRFNGLWTIPFNDEQKPLGFCPGVFSRNSMKMFFPTTILAIVIMTFCKNKDIDTIGWIGLGVTLAQLISYVVIIYLTESALKKEFDIGVENDKL